MASSILPDQRAPFWSRSLQRPILLAVLVACFDQLSGINAVLYFAPRISEWTSLGIKLPCCSRWGSI